MKDFNIPTVNLSMDTLIHECSKTSRPTEDIFVDLSLWNRENIHEVFRYRKFNYDFIDYVTCFNDGEHVIGMIRPSYDDFLIKVSRILGITDTREIVDDENLTKRLLGRIERLKQITSERELRYEFPSLYDDLIQGRGFINAVEQMPKKTAEEQAIYERLRHYYYSCALKQRIDRFVKTQVELYTRFVTKRKEYKELISSKSMNGYFRNNFDMDKVALYAAHQYLYRCEHASSDEEYEEFMSYLDKYLNSDYNKEVEIRTKKGTIINFANLLERIKKVKEKHDSPEVLVNWELVPEGEQITFAREVETPRALSMKKQDVEALKEAGRRKEEFYTKTHPIGIIRGKEKNDRYIGQKRYVGYVYPNGQVLLDTEFDIGAPSSAKGNAIYNMKVRDFEKLSRMDKTVLRNHPKVGRIYHSKHWEEKAQEIIDRQGDLLDQEEAKELIRKLRKK